MEKEEYPNSVELEQAILGAMLLNKTTMIELCDSLSFEDFYNKTHKNILSSLKKYIKQTDSTTDSYNCLIFLRNNNLTDSCGGNAYLNSLIDNSPDIVNLDVYLSQLKNYTLKRKLIETARETIETAKDNTQDAISLVDNSISSLIELSKTNTKEASYKGTDIVENLKKTISKFGLATPSSLVVPSGFKELDKKIGGFRGGQFAVIGARPSTGKTAFALTCCLQMLCNNISEINENEEGELIEIKRKPKIAFFSLEMPKEDIIKRLVSILSCINLSSFYGIKQKEETEKIESNINDSLDSLSTILSNFFIYDNSETMLSNLRASIRSLKHKENIDLVFIDYMQLINTSNLKSKEIWERVQEVSLSLKSLARELNISIVCLSQLNRDAEKQRPTLAMLRNSGAIEQDADLIIFLYDAYKSQEKKEYRKVKFRIGDNSFDCKEARPIDVIIAKQRNGEIGDSKLLFLADFTRFASYEDCEGAEEDD